jgi:hypothetical protein
MFCDRSLEGNGSDSGRFNGGSFFPSAADPSGLPAAGSHGAFAATRPRPELSSQWLASARPPPPARQRPRVGPGALQMPRLVSRPRSWPGAIMRLKRGEKRRSETSRSTGAPPSMGDEPGSVAPTSRLPESAAEHNSNIATGSSCSPRCQPDTGHGGLLAHVLTS